MPLKQILTLLACGGLMACVATPNEPPRPKPSLQKIKADILKNKSALFIDPGSVRDAAIGAVNVYRGSYEVCLMSNAKNMAGGYTGLSPTIVTVYDNGAFYANERMTIYSTSWCQSEPFTPFPELNSVK